MLSVQSSPLEQRQSTLHGFSVFMWKENVHMVIGCEVNKTTLFLVSRFCLVCAMLGFVSTLTAN